MGFVSQYTLFPEIDTDLSIGSVHSLVDGTPVASIITLATRQTFAASQVRPLVAFFFRLPADLHTIDNLLGPSGPIPPRRSRV